MKNDSHFILKALFVFEAFKFCPDFFCYVGKRHDKETMVNLKLRTSQPGKQIIEIHILPIISTSKSKQTMEFGQLIEYNEINIFLQKSCRK